MRWSMVPVSAAIHGAIVVALIINTAVAGDLPRPWPVSGFPTYVAATPVPPLPRTPVPSRANVSNNLAPTVAPNEIRDEIDVPTAPVSDGPIDPYGLPDASAGMPPGPWTGVSVPPSPPPAPPVRQSPQLVRSGGLVREPKKIFGPPPAYPEIARAARIQGMVVIEAVIDERGLVTDARVLRGQPMLDGAALAALKQWRYTPTLLNGVPVRVLMTITFNFQLDNRTP
jgi:periplasmic protein TonB